MSQFQPCRSDPISCETDAQVLFASQPLVCLHKLHVLQREEEQLTSWEAEKG